MNKPSHSVLIAEDNPGLARVLGFKFKAAGYEVITAADGQAAWELFTKKPASAVVSDQEMPRMTGVELCRAIRNVDSGVPLFLVTGRQLELATTGIVEELCLTQMFGKPFSPATIVAEVTQAILSRQTPAAVHELAGANAQFCGGVPAVVPATPVSNALLPTSV